MDKIIVLDFGGQYAHLIASQIRKLNVFSEIKNPEASLEEFKNAKGIILSGGPTSVYEKEAPKVDSRIFELNIPVLGICYGHHLMAQTLAKDYYSAVEKQPEKGEYGKTELTIQCKNKLFENLKDREQVWMSHQDQVVKLPPGFIVTASTQNCQIAAMSHVKKPFFGIQFHPEVTHTLCGKQIFDNFLKICGVKRSWTVTNFIKRIVSEIRDKVGSRNVILLASGGVDSTVTLQLLNLALGKERVKAIYIDTGLGRKNETQEILENMKRSKITNLEVIDGSQKFLKPLKKIIHPEQKRQTIGMSFIQIWQEYLQKLRVNPNQWMLAQGTIYPDTIETARTPHADLIKTHHNRIKEVQELIKKGALIEPIQELYKDEVREVGKELKLSQDILFRHPFPGPGLAVRILCHSGKLTQNEKKKFKELPHKEVSDLCHKSGYEGYILPLRSVGVQGDQRSYAHPVAICGPKDWEKLSRLSTQITNTFKGVINRVIYYLSDGCFPKGLRLKKAYLTKKRISLLQGADWIVRRELKLANRIRSIWQIPVILVPISFSGKGESIILRPINSENAMTAEFHRMPWPLVDHIKKKVLNLEKIEAVFYDLTNKPPGTIEWE